MDTTTNYLVELCEDEAETKDGGAAIGDNLEISLHALLGTFNPRIIRMKGVVGKRMLSILVGSGGTHNYIQRSLVKKLGWKYNHYQSLMCL